MTTTTLVTGATGFIGRRLVQTLGERGRKVRALVRSATSANLPNVELAIGDITQPTSLTAAMRGIDTVFHLAARIGDWGPEREFVAINVDGTRNVLRAAAEQGVRRVVVVSSIVVYGDQLTRPGVIDESTPVMPGVGAYARSKVAVEEMIRANPSPQVTIVRPGNVYGPGSALWVDELVQLLRRGVAMWLGDGNGDASLAYVDNVIDVMIRADENEVAAGRIYNALDGHGVTWREYLTFLAEAAGAKPPRKSISPRLAHAAAVAMESSWRAFGAKQRPLLTREAVQLLASRATVSTERAQRELKYRAIDGNVARAAVAHDIVARL